MARYIEILALQRPFPFDTDEAGRIMFSCNYMMTIDSPELDFEESIVAYLATQSPPLAQSGVDTFIGPAVVTPSGSGPYTLILATGGTAPLETHNGDLYERPTMQIIVRAQSYSVARTRAYSIFRALDGVRNVTL